MAEQPTKAELAARIDELNQAAIVDQEIIAQLEQDGVIDRDKIANMELALVTCRRIGAAMGILMASMKLTEDAAFDLLRTISQNTHRKLREVAESVVLTGTVEPPG
jgi:AmiR/NasT family two-component response regulator